MPPRDAHRSYVWLISYGAKGHDRLSLAVVRIVVHRGAAAVRACVSGCIGAKERTARDQVPYKARDIGFPHCGYSENKKATGLATGGLGGLGRDGVDALDASAPRQPRIYNPDRRKTP